MKTIFILKMHQVVIGFWNASGTVLEFMASKGIFTNWCYITSMYCRLRALDVILKDLRIILELETE